MSEIHFSSHSFIDDEGDVRPLADLSGSERYSDISNTSDIVGEFEAIDEERDIEAVRNELQAIVCYEAQIELKSLIAKGADDKDVRKRGGIKKCDTLRHEALLEARKSYLDSLGIRQHTAPDLDAPSDRLDEYDRGVLAWAAFRDDKLSDPSFRMERSQELQRIVGELHPK